MRERTLRVNKDKLVSLGKVYKPKKIADSLDISKQRWNNYQSGRHDVPESVVDRLCEQYNLSKSDIVLMP